MKDSVQKDHWDDLARQLRQLASQLTYERLENLRQELFAAGWANDPPFPLSTRDAVAHVKHHVMAAVSEELLQRSKQTRTILAVDDSTSMRQMVSFTLKNAGFDVVLAVDGQDAYEKAMARDFNLVLTDQNMPRMDGVSLTRKLRENPKFKATPILILTTESSDQMKQSGRAAGATGWLVKPFDPAKLVEVIRKVIR